MKGEGKHSFTQRLPCYNKKTNARDTKNKLVDHHFNTIIIKSSNHKNMYAILHTNFK